MVRVGRGGRWRELGALPPGLYLRGCWPFVGRHNARSAHCVYNSQYCIRSLLQHVTAAVFLSK